MTKTQGPPQEEAAIARSGNSLQKAPTCIWMTGLSGAGKSTLANALALRLREAGCAVYELDGDRLRLGLNSDLGFTVEDRNENVRRVGEVARLLVDAGLTVIVSLISPIKKEREWARALFPEGGFVEVFVDTPIALCEGRDVKGLYAKARSGLFKNFTGIDSPYEAPESPEVHLRCHGQTVDETEEALWAQVKVWALPEPWSSTQGLGCGNFNC